MRLSRLLLGVLMVILVGCQVEVEVELDVTEDGSGTITTSATFDNEATTALGDIAEQLRIDDLEQAGWSVAVEEIGSGSTLVTAVRQVSGANQWQQALDEIAGPGVFNQVRVQSNNGFARARQSVAFDVDLSDGWELIVEEDGDAINTATSARAIDDVVAVRLITTVDSGGDAAPTRDVSEQRFDAPERLRVSLVSTAENTTAILLRWIAIALFALFVLALVLAVIGIILQRRADRRRPAPTPASLASRVPGADGSPVAPLVSDADASAGVRLVVVEPLTVLYQQPPFAAVSVLGFVRDHGGSPTANVILDGFAAVIIGSISSADFWRLCNVDGGVAADLDQAFIDQRRMRKGASGFLAEMERRRIPVAATSTDGSNWSRQTRERDRLSQVWPWLTSGDVGALAGNVAMFEVLHRESGVAYEHCLYVDTDEERLDVARELGMKTALFTTESAEAEDASSHEVVVGFKGLL